MAKYRRPGSNSASNMQGLLRQAQKMQEEMARAQEELAAMEFTAQAGGGAVSVVIGGDKVIRELAISPDIVDPEDISMMSDIIVAAVNEAIKTVEEYSAQRMSSLTGGMNMPGL